LAARAACGVRIAGSSSYVTLPRRAARRALSWLSATTMKIGWPTYCTRPSARIGSSWMIGPQSLVPGMSCAV
jgi:hypothetical protein